jgi:chaperonin GroEL
MSIRKAKSAAKSYLSDQDQLKKIVLRTMKKVSDIVGSSLGPGGRVTLIEESLPNIPNRLTKDGVTIFKNLGSPDAYEHLIIESARDAAVRTANTVGDGTTTATILSYNIIKFMFDFVEKNPKYSPQKAIRKIHKAVKETLIPYIESRAIKITEENKELVRKVATISANGDTELADAVIQAFELLGYSDSSHVTIREATGGDHYDVTRIDGMPIPSGMEDLGKFANIFVNDNASLRCHLIKPIFILFDGMINDLINITPILNQIGEAYSNGDENYKNVIIVAHGFADNVMTTLAYNFANPSTINIVPLRTPMAQFNNSQQQFLYDLGAFCNAKVFGMKDQLSTATLSNLGTGMESFEMYRFRSTVVGESDSVNIEIRADDLKKMKENAESVAEKIWLEERLGKLTGGIVKLTIFSNSSGSLKEKADRVEDAVCAAKSAITYGCLPGGCRVSIDMATLLARTLPENDPAREVLMSSLLCLPEKLLSNAGYNEEEIKEIVGELIRDPDVVYDVENEVFGKAEELGLFDPTRAVQDSLENSVSIASLFGAIGGIISFERDPVFEREEARADADFGRAVNSPEQFINEANNRP